jgi:O-antigen/teichoic acid export membrane protein
MILSLLVPRRELGLYTVAVTLSSVVSMFPQAIGIVTFSRGATLGRDEAKRTIGVSIRTSLFWLFTSCVLIYALTPFLIKFFFGAGFEGSIVACRILLPGSVMVGLNQVLYNGANALGHLGTPSIAEGVSLVLTAVGLYILIPRYGYIGAAVVSSASYTLSFLVMLVLARVKLGLHLRELFWESTMS